MSDTGRNAPFFSVVIPTYNRAEYISQAIASVLEQDCSDFELLVVDDGSSDNTLELIGQFSDARLTVIAQENQGRSWARNNGIEASKGEFVCFLDSDDFWEKDHLSQMQSLIGSNDRAEGFYHGGLFWYYHDENRDTQVEYVPRPEFSSDVEYVIHNQFAPDTVAISRGVLTKHQFNPQLFINEDLELWARIAAEFPVFAHERPTAHLRVHEGNTSNLVNDHVAPQIEVFRMQLKEAKVRAQLSKAFITERMRTFRMWHIRLWKKQGKRAKLLGSIVDYIIHHPKDRNTPSLFLDLLYALPIIGDLLALRKKS